MRHRLLALWAVSFAAAAWCSGAAAASGPTLSPVKSTFPERTFVLTLPKGSSVEDGKLQLLENGQPVDRLAVAPTDFGGFVLVIDTSQSMRGKRIEAAMEAARAFARQRQSHEKLAVVTFDAEARVLLPFTTDAARIDEALSTVPPLQYYTRTYDALVKAADLVRSESIRSPAIVLLSDGEEFGSTVSREAAIAATQRAEISIFSVGLATGPVGTEALRQLSFDTGGTSVRASSPEALAAIYEELAYQLSAGYLVQYRSFAGPGEHVTVEARIAGVEGSASASYRSPALPASVPPAFDDARAQRAAQSRLTMFFIALLVAALLGVSVTTLIRPRHGEFLRRLGTFVSLSAHESKRQTSVLTERLLAGTDQSLGRTRWWDRFKHELVVAEVRIPAEQLVVLSVIGTFFAGWLLYVVFGRTAALLALGLPLVVRGVIRFRADRQRRLFADQLPDNLQVIASALRAGHSFVGALSVVVEEAPEPSRREFRRVVADEQLGIALEDSLHEVGERMECRDLEQVAMVAALQRETGGNSAEVLDQVAENIRERAALRRLVRTLTAQGRMARWIVSALPVGLLLIITALNRDYMEPLFSKTGGRILLGFAAAMIVAGSVVIRKIVDIRV